MTGIIAWLCIMRKTMKRSFWFVYCPSAMCWRSFHRISLRKNWKTESQNRCSCGLKNEFATFFPRFSSYSLILYRHKGTNSNCIVAKWYSTWFRVRRPRVQIPPEMVPCNNKGTNSNQRIAKWLKHRSHPLATRVRIPFHTVPCFNFIKAPTATLRIGTCGFESHLWENGALSH